MADDDDRWRVRRAEDDDFRSERPRRRDEEEEDFEDRRPRRRIRRDEGDATGGLIPYKNPKALAAYYCGVFGLISCVLLLGIFGVVPIILGVQGLKHAGRHPEARGQAHAVVGIALGALEVLTFLLQVGFIIVTLTTGKK